MSLKFGNQSKTSKFDVSPIGKGQFPARVVQVLDLGIQEWEGMSKEVKTGPRVFITFEFPTKRIDIEENGETVSKPRWLSKEYTVSNFEQAGLYKLIQNIHPAFDFETDSLEDLIGLSCMVVVGVTSTGKDKVVNVNPPIDGIDVPELENPPKVFDMADPDWDVFLSLPKWIQKKLMEAVNYKNSPLERLVILNKYSLS